jgi:hypothetical protein
MTKTVTITEEAHRRLTMNVPADMHSVQVGDELILRVRVAQVQPANFGWDVRVCMEDGSGMLAPIPMSTVLTHIPMHDNDLPRIGSGRAS